MPTARTSFSRFRSSTARCQSRRRAPTRRSRRGTAAGRSPARRGSPGSSPCTRGCDRAGTRRSTGYSACAGHFMFFGGILVATTTRASRCAASIRPSSVSLWPLPYTQAVSKKLQPSASARSSEASDSSSSEPVHAAHAPHAVADFRDLPARPSEGAVAHPASVQSRTHDRRRGARGLCRSPTSADRAVSRCDAGCFRDVRGARVSRRLGSKGAPEGAGARPSVRGLVSRLGARRSDHRPRLRHDLAQKRRGAAAADRPARRALLRARRRAPRAGRGGDHRRARSRHAGREPPRHPARRLLRAGVRERLLRVQTRRRTHGVDARRPVGGAALEPVARQSEERGRTRASRSERGRRREALRRRRPSADRGPARHASTSSGSSSRARR